MKVECYAKSGVLRPIYIDAWRTGLTGPIPSSIGDLTQLYGIDFYDNAITTIPSEFASLTKLQKLYLSYNALSGQLTRSVLTPSLTTLWLNSNEISSFPDTPVWGDIAFNDLSFQDNKLVSVPPTFRDVQVRTTCYMWYQDEDFSCGNVNYDSDCCIGWNGCGESKPGGKCYGQVRLKRIGRFTIHLVQQRI